MTGHTCSVCAGAVFSRGVFLKHLRWVGGCSVRKLKCERAIHAGCRKVEYEGWSLRVCWSSVVKGGSSRALLQPPSLAHSSRILDS